MTEPVPSKSSVSGAPTLDARSLLDLEPGWDTYDGARITLRAVTTANNLAAVPLNDGGIQLELHAGGVDIEIEIDSAGQVRGILWEPSRA